MSGFSELVDPVTKPTADPGYSTRKPNLKRIGLASFLCGVAACVTVSLIAILIAFVYFQISAVSASQSAMNNAMSNGGLLGGAGMATVMAAFNWYVGYITIPVAWLVLGLSLGRFPRRGIIRAAPYYRWGAIWGAILVGTTSSIATGLVAGWQVLSIIGALGTGLFIGAVAGCVCGWLFRAIVRPGEQINNLQVDVF